MPRKTAEQRREEAAAVAAAARPFAFDSTAAYAAQSDEDRLAIASSIAADKVAGLSGDELRAKYGERLSGPARRKVLREHGLTAGTIARSYDSYRDGDSRSGTRHAREHGSAAEQRRAEQRDEAVAEYAAAKSARKGRSKADRDTYAERLDAAAARCIAVGAEIPV